MNNPQVYILNGNLWYNVKYPLPEKSEIIHGALVWYVAKGDTVTVGSYNGDEVINKDDLPLVLDFYQDNE
jgi:hypothetical protein